MQSSQEAVGRRHLPKLLVIGYAGHGKDTVAEALSHYNYECMSSSYACAEKIMMPYFASIGINYPDVGTCFEDRINHRPIWFNQIAAYNHPDGSRLAREILRTNQAYIGMRNRLEFDACKELFDYVVWVDASKRLPPEGSLSMQLTPEDADWIIDNNQTKRGLDLRVTEFLRAIGVRTSD